MSATATPAARPGGGLGWAVSDHLVMIRRCLTRNTRTPDALFLAVALPLVMLLMMVYIFGGAIGSRDAYLQYVVPGIILLSAGYGASTTAVGVAHDLTEGTVDRFRSMPLHASSVLTGHVVAGLARNLTSTGLVLAAAVGIGFRPNAGIGEWAAAVGLVALFATALSWIAVLLGLLARSVEAASGYTLVFFFLPYVSTAFAEGETLPDGLRGFAENQPVTPMIEAVRGLLTGTPMGDSALLAVLWFGSITVVAAAGASGVFRRRAR